MTKISSSAIRNPQSAIKLGKLYGVGIGPGDPKLLTIRAKEILDTVSTIFVPRAKDDAKSCARSIVEAAVSKPKNFIEITFPMTKDRKRLESYWLGAAKRIAKELKKERIAAFVTIGDPFIYSTYIYLLETLRKKFPDIRVETIPGISAFNAAAASSGLPLVKGDEKLAVLPVTRDLKGLRETLEKFDTVVLMKVGSKLNRVICLLKETGLIKDSVLISHAGQASEKIISDLSSLSPVRSKPALGIRHQEASNGVRKRKSGYLSVIIVKSKRIRNAEWGIRNEEKKQSK